MNITSSPSGPGRQILCLTNVIVAFDLHSTAAECFSNSGPTTEQFKLCTSANARYLWPNHDNVYRIRYAAANQLQTATRSLAKLCHTIVLVQYSFEPQYTEQSENSADTYHFAKVQYATFLTVHDLAWPWLQNLISPEHNITFVSHCKQWTSQHLAGVYIAQAWILKFWIL